MNQELQFQRFSDIVALRTASGQVVGFHCKNLEVAELSEEAWLAFAEKAGVVYDELKAWSEDINPNVKSGTKGFGVRALTINVNQICNLHCAYCLAGGDGSFGDPVKKIAMDQTLPQLEALMKKVPAGESFHITFMGGEPLLSPEGIEILAHRAWELAEAGGFHIRFTVVTNGTLFTEKNIALLRRLKAEVTVSLDGPPEVNDRTRPSKGGRGTTETVIQGLKALLNFKSELTSIGISGVFGGQNMEIEKAYSFYRQFDVDWFDFTFDHLNTDSHVSRAFMGAVSQVAGQAFLEGGERQLRKIKLFDTYFKLLDQQQRVENYCGAGKSYFMIDARNNIYTCPWVVGQAKEVVGHGTVIWEDKLSPYQAPLIEKQSCQNCWARFMCGGGCMFIHQNKTGDKRQVDENFCERTRYLIAQALLYYERSRSLQEERIHS